MQELTDRAVNDRCVCVIKEVPGPTGQTAEGIQRLQNLQFRELQTPHLSHLEVGVEFVAIIPTADKLTILAAVADHEREAISERIEAALAAAKARGKRLGTVTFGRR
jgi:hypothetical protein